MQTTKQSSPIWIKGHAAHSCGLDLEQANNSYAKHSTDIKTSSKLINDIVIRIHPKMKNDRNTWKSHKVSKPRVQQNQ